MSEERVLTAGFLSKDSKFELVVSGKVGAREIANLIRKLQIDLVILEEDESAEMIDATPES